jgi:hypothetical protein
MTKPFDATFKPLTAAQRLPAPLPQQVQRQLREADNIVRAIQFNSFKRPKRGQKGQVRYGPFIWFSADSDPELAMQLNAYWNAVGKKARGNKRIGKAALYADLVKHFLLLKRKGVTRPRNKSLSKKACQFGLGEILRRHGCTKVSDHLLLNNGIARQKIATRMDRIFSRVSTFV